MATYFSASLNVSHRHWGNVLHTKNCSCIWICRRTRDKLALKCKSLVTINLVRRNVSESKWNSNVVIMSSYAKCAWLLPCAQNSGIKIPTKLNEVSNNSNSIYHGRRKKKDFFRHEKKTYINYVQNIYLGAVKVCVCVCLFTGVAKKLNNELTNHRVCARNSPIILHPFGFRVFLLLSILH